MAEQDPPSKTKVLYDAISQDYDLGTFEEFDQKLKDPTKRKAFYDGVGSEYQLGSYSDFEIKVGAKKKYGQRICEYFSNIWRAITTFPSAYY